MTFGRFGNMPSKTNLNSLTSDDQTEDNIPFDKFREECGVIAVYGHPEAANLAHLGLYALQHRGQESAGIASADSHSGNKAPHCFKGMGHIADLFTPEVLG